MSNATEVIGDTIYRVSQEEYARLREGVPYAKYTDITQNTYVQSGTVTEIMAREFETLTAVTHLLITKYILKLAGICGFCNVNSCT